LKLPKKERFGRGLGCDNISHEYGRRQKVFNLPKLIILGLGALAIWYGYKAVKREIARVREELRKADIAEDSAAKIQPLEKDKDGVYRLKDD